MAQSGSVINHATNTNSSEISVAEDRKESDIRTQNHKDVHIPRCGSLYYWPQSFSPPSIHALCHELFRASHCG